MVIDDAELAAAIQRRRGQWSAQFGGTLSVETADASALESTSPPAADVIVYLSRHLGPLATRGAIVPLRSNMLSGEPYRPAELFPLVARPMAAWGERPMAFALGSPVLVLIYRADLLAALDRQPPRTWSEYASLVDELGQQTATDAASEALPDDWQAAIEPVAPGWAGITLLARAAAYAKHPHDYATLFDAQTMEPRIDGPPFVRALRELAESNRGDVATKRYDPHEARRAVYEGRAALAWGWPTAADDAGGEAIGQVRFAELPGAEQVYRQGLNQWEPRPENRRRVTLLGVAGRLASVSAASRNAASAMNLAAWLSAGDVQHPPSAASRETTLYRQPHLPQIDPWLPQGISPEAADGYANVVREALSRDDWMAVPRIPGAERYMTALDKAVIDVLDGNASPEMSLAAAKQQWLAITEELGVQRQRAAYARSLGLEPIGGRLDSPPE
ncbi:MAG: extracellular solute-binding protein [Pirellulales bacterium]